MTHTLRTALLAVVLVLAVPVLGACSDDEDEDGVKGKAVSSSAASTLGVDEETAQNEMFINDYRKMMPKNAAGFDDEKIVDVAQRVCDVIDDDGVDVSAVKQDLSKMMDHNGVRPNDEAVIRVMKLAVGDTCPAQQKKLDAALK